MDRRRFLPTYHYEDTTDGVLLDSAGKPLRDYKVCGNSVQSGTPTPEAPVEIESVGDKTDDGKYKVPIKVNSETINIYLDEPLRKVGDMADYIDFKNGRVVRNTQAVTLTSGKAYAYVYSGMNGIRFDSTLQEGGNRYSGYSTHSNKIYMKAQQGEMWCGANGNTSVYWIGIVDLLGLTTINEFKAWLNSQEIPVKVVCPRTTPILEQIELPTIPTAKGTCNVVVDAEIQPSGVSWQYYRT